MAARRTTMNIDHERVAQAQEILGTENATATVHKALDEVIRRFHLERLAEWRFPDDAWALIQESRRPKLESDEGIRHLPDAQDEAS